MATTRKRARRTSRRTFGSVWQLPSGRYRASYLAPDGKRRAGETTFATVADADARLSTIQADINRGKWRPPEPSRETVGDYAGRWLALGVGRDGKSLSPTTAELYELLWRRWLEPTFGDFRRILGASEAGAASNIHLRVPSTESLWPHIDRGHIPSPSCDLRTTAPKGGRSTNSESGYASSTTVAGVFGPGTCPS
jgi:hypothetical protein